MSGASQQTYIPSKTLKTQYPVCRVVNWPCHATTSPVIPFSRFGLVLFANH